MVQITVPSEFQPLDKVSIGITVDINNTLSDSSWIEGWNRVNAILISFVHTRTVLSLQPFLKR